MESVRFKDLIENRLYSLYFIKTNRYCTVLRTCQLYYYDSLISDGIK